MFSFTKRSFPIALIGMFPVILGGWFLACRDNNKIMQDKQNRNHSPHLIVISLDGYCPGYTAHYGVKSLQKMEKEGVFARCIPPFPCKTLVSHLSIITGLYPQNHGCVSDRFYDTAKSDQVIRSEKFFQSGGASLLERGTPIWSALEAKKIKTANILFPGGAKEIYAGSLSGPTYDHSSRDRNPYQKDFMGQVKQAIEWLKMPASNRPHFISLYYRWVDYHAHFEGPYNAQVKSEINKVDQALESLHQFIQSSPLNINLIVLSDHGMVEINQSDWNTDQQKLRPALKRLLDELESKFSISREAMIVMLYPRLNATDQDLESAYQRLKHFASDHGNRLDVYRKKDIPSHLNFQNSRRIGGIVLLARPTHLLVIKEKASGKYEKGDHGFDPTMKEMHGVFYAYGPAFKKNFNAGSFENIHVYPTILQLMGVSCPDRIDGKPLLSILQPSPKGTNQ